MVTGWAIVMVVSRKVREGDSGGVKEGASGSGKVDDGLKEGAGGGAKMGDGVKEGAC